jgi:hypothetical protein
MGNLELLPTEIIWMVVCHLSHNEVKRLSLTCKRLRSACLPYLFRRVGFDFSEKGLGALESLLHSSLKQHVVSLHWVVPELLLSGKFPDILPNLSRVESMSEVRSRTAFESNLLTQSAYADALGVWNDFNSSESWMGGDDTEGNYPLYNLVFEIF